MQDIIKRILYEWQERKLPQTFPRPVSLAGYLNLQPKKIVAITGFRRVGKTYLLLHLIQELLKSYSKEEIVYINFEDERIPKETEFLSNLIPVIKQTFRKLPQFLFLDELQDIPLWSQWLRRIYDTENINMFVTGSSSKVSSREIPTELRGRCLEINLFPLSLQEFLTFKQIDIDLEAVKYSDNEKIKLNNALEEYVFYGGMPEIAFTSEDRKQELLQEYYRTMLRKDIVERFRIKNEAGLLAMIRLLLNSTYFSISKLYNNMKSLGHEIGKGTLQRYVSYLESSYFFHQLLVLSPKIKEQLQSSRKVYFIDNGFLSALSMKFSNNFGRLYENTVFLELKRLARNDDSLFFWKNNFGKEVDFVIKNDLQIKQLIQVCYDIKDQETRKRELSALISASKELGCKDLLVITNDYEGTEKIKNNEARFLPLWKWLLASH